MLERVLAAEQTDARIVDVSWFHGFPYTDIPHSGSYVAVTAEDAVSVEETTEAYEALETG